MDARAIEGADEQEGLTTYTFEYRYDDEVWTDTIDAEDEHQAYEEAREYILDHMTGTNWWRNPPKVKLLQ